MSKSDIKDLRLSIGDHDAISQLAEDLTEMGERLENIAIAYEELFAHVTSVKERGGLRLFEAICSNKQ